MIKTLIKLYGMLNDLVDEEIDWDEYNAGISVCMSNYIDVCGIVPFMILIMLFAFNLPLFIIVKIIKIKLNKD